MEGNAKSKAANSNELLKPFDILIGEWKTVGKHPLVPGVTLTGTTRFKWLENGAFIQMNNFINHEQFPDGIAIIGSDNSSPELIMLYFDERGLPRRYNCILNDNSWNWWRDDPGFSQHFHGEIQDKGNTIIVKGKMSQNSRSWEDDLQLTYSRISFEIQRLLRWYSCKGGWRACYQLHICKSALHL